MRNVMDTSERRACRAIGQPRSTPRHKRKVPDDKERLTSQIVMLATQFGRYGYRRITALLRNDGWRVNYKRVERIRRREGLKVPQKQPKRGRLWLNDGSCIRLRPERKDHVWSYDRAMERTSDGRPLRILAIIDEYTRECLALHVTRRTRSGDVLDALYELFLRKGLPEYIRSDNGLEFAAKAVRKSLNRLDVTTLFIEPRSPWENGYIESFIHRQDAGRASERRGARYASRSEGAYRGLEKDLQSPRAPQLVGIQAAGAGGAFGRKNHSRAGTMQGDRSGQFRPLSSLGNLTPEQFVAIYKKSEAKEAEKLHF